MAVDDSTGGTADATLQATIQAMDVEELRELVMTLAQRDDGVRRMLEIRATTMSGDDSRAKAELEALVRKMLEFRGFIDYRRSFEVAEVASEVLDELEDHVNSGAADVARPASLLAVTRLRKLLEHVDDSSGSIGDQCQRTADLYALACRLADARAWIEDALSKPALAPKTGTWPLYKALVQWLMSQLPEGGERRSPPGDPEFNEELCDTFSATSSAAPFIEHSHRDLLLELFETGTGDPLRWSSARVEQALGGSAYNDHEHPLEVALDAADLLRAFIPYAHAQSGIRDELTSRTLAMVDAVRSDYKRDVLRQAKYWDLDDAV